MSTKIESREIQVNDFIEFNLYEKIKGLVRKTQQIARPEGKLKYVEIITEKGLRTAYLKFTDEVIKFEKDKIQDFEKMTAMYECKNLFKTIDKLGSDPEIFAVDKNNEVVPSFMFLQSKEKPNTYNYRGINPIFWDGFQAEFNTTADSCLAWVTDSVHLGLKEMNRLLKAYDKDARLTIQPTFDILPHLLTEGKEEHVQFGCMPSFNVYGMKGKVADGREVPFRSAGGHIHFGLQADQFKKIPEYVKALDAILGVACVSLFGQFDDVRRREYYGLAGEYRTPKHGLEYRTLSNVWMSHPIAMQIVFELGRKVISLVDKGLFKHWQADELDVIACINECNIPLACEILKNNEEMFKAIITSFSYQREDTVKVIYNTFLMGLEVLLDDVDNVAKNWQLESGTWVTHNEGAGMTINRISELKKYNEVLKLKF